MSQQKKRLTYESLEKALIGLGFEKHRVDGYVAFSEQAHKALIALPITMPTDEVLPRHLSAARAEVTGMGIADEAAFEDALME